MGSTSTEAAEVMATSLSDCQKVTKRQNEQLVPISQNHQQDPNKRTVISTPSSAKIRAA